MDENFIEIKNLEKAKRLLKDIPNGIERASVRAINRTLVTLKKDLKKEVTQNYGIKSTEVERAMKTKKANFSKIFGTVRARAPVLSLIKFLNSSSSRGIYVTVIKNGGKKKLTRNPELDGNPFIAQMKNGHRGIFQKKKDKKTVKKVLKSGEEKEIKVAQLQELKSVSIPQMLGSKTVMEYINNSGKVENVLEKNFDREVEKILKGYL